jgi:hypothetical protein
MRVYVVYYSFLASPPSGRETWGIGMAHFQTRAFICVLLGTASIGLTPLTRSTAIAQQIDMRTLRPGYINELGQFVSGISPYYSQSTTSTSLQIVGEPNLPNDLGTHNQTTILPINGDFSAVITAAAGPHAGGFFDVDVAGGYVGPALNDNKFGQTTELALAT